MNKLISLLFLLVFTLAVAGCSASDNMETSPKNENEVVEIELMISAAVSLTDALDDIKTLYEKDHNVTLTFNLGGSGSLAQQIRQGAPVDVFISANQEWMDILVDEDLVNESTREDITGNKLVLITGNDSAIDYDSIDDIIAADLEQVAVGNPESVPAGKYTEQVLLQLNLWNDLENKLVLGKDVRQVLTYVETGNVDIGFVYESDALSSDAVKVLATAEEGTHDPVVYPGAMLNTTQHAKEATEFIAFLTSNQAQEILLEHGFRK